ncbi:MAG: TRAP transporter small permease subunit [Gammaproteobacteria bacterium]|jgi:TRAP-type mannitol/chloroaromatic compound transport system permease small subunit|nr:TRAP transporter small permease subunit [Gammaproteobacteria bacterium]
MVFLVRLISSANTLLGRLFAWLSLAMVLVCFTVVIMRYVFTSGFVWMQDLYVWMNGAMFMGVAGYTLLQNGHVRVDIFYRPASLRFKAWVDILGSLFFIGPFIWILVQYSLPFVQRSWRFYEGSANYGGMPGLFVLKSFILLFAAVVGLQALAMLLRGILVLRNQEQLLPESLRYQEAQ